MAETFFYTLLARGYFPEILPPSFTTASFAKFADKKKNAFDAVEKNPTRLRGVDYSASKSGYRRRGFTVAHPISQFFVAQFVQQHWKDFEKYFKLSAFSASVPGKTTNPTGRSVEITSFREVHSIIHERLGRFPFVAKSDVQHFYPSIYTHSIPWAFHGKAAAKADGNANSATVYFNKLDQCVRRGQDGQTIGIPIGPDTSRVIGELVGSAIDARLKELAGDNLADCIRHVDDIYMASSSRAGASACIAAYRRALREYGLELNEIKTQVYSASGLRDSLWAKSIQRRFSEYKAETKKEQKPALLFGLFEETFELAEKLNSEAPVRFLLRWGDREGVFEDGNWNIAENFLVKCVYDYPHTIDFVARIVLWHDLFGADVSQEKWTYAINNCLKHHLSMGHDQEISWLIWMALGLNYLLDKNISALLATYDNALIALMAVHAVQKSLINKLDINMTYWESKVCEKSFTDEWWIFAYECKHRGWIEGSVDGSTVAGKFFKTLHDADITFYAADVPAAEEFEEDSPAIPLTSFGYEEIGDEEDEDDEPF